MTQPVVPMPNDAAGAHRRGGGRLRIAERLRQFVEVEAAGGAVLAVATVVALAWANSPWRHGYDAVWNTAVVVGLGRWSLSTDVVHLVDDGLMAVFFFVIGLEIKWEWVEGELRDRRAALLPAVAALGGMVLPALIFLAVVGSSAGSHGWGIPMATDIAFAVGVMALLGRRVPSSLKVFLLTLAIVDDLGAIVVIAVVYSGELHWSWLAVAAAGLAVVVVGRAARVRPLLFYVLVGSVVWFATWRSGVHATIAGVVLGFLTPASPVAPRHDRRRPESESESVPESGADAGAEPEADVDAEPVSPLDRLQSALHPWSSFLIVPLFALANAGVRLSSGFEGPGGRVLVGVCLGLVLGKPLGVVAASWLVVRLGLASKPVGATWGQFLGLGFLAGIGFTVSLFVTDLAFVGDPLATQLAARAKVGVLIASVVASCLGGATLVWSRRRAHAAVAAQAS